MNVYFPTNLASPCSPYCGSTSPPPTTLNSLHFDKLYTKSRPHGRDFAGKPIISIIFRGVICSRVKRLVTSSYFHFCWCFSSFFLNAHYNKILRVMKIWKYLNHFYINNKILYKKNKQRHKTIMWNLSTGDHIKSQKSLKIYIGYSFIERFSSIEFRSYSLLKFCTSLI